MGALKERKDESVGGGHFVFRRGKRTGRIAVSHYRVPFEHPSFDAACAEAYRLAAENPNERYVVVSQQASYAPKGKK